MMVTFHLFGEQYSALEGEHTAPSYIPRSGHSFWHPASETREDDLLYNKIVGQDDIFIAILPVLGGHYQCYAVVAEKLKALSPTNIVYYAEKDDNSEIHSVKEIAKSYLEAMYKDRRFKNALVEGNVILLLYSSAFQVGLEMVIEFQKQYPEKASTLRIAALDPTPKLYFKKTKEELVKLFLHLVSQCLYRNGVSRFVNPRTKRKPDDEQREPIWISWPFHDESLMIMR